MLDPDERKRRENLAYVTERCALAEEVGARCCVDIAGSYNPTVWYGPNPKNLSREFFDATVANCRHIIDAVKPTRTKFTIEMMGWNLPDGPDTYLDLIKAVDRKAFGVHLDVCNGVNCPARFYRNTEFIRGVLRQTGAMDRFLPCQRFAVDHGVECAFLGSHSRARADRLPGLFAGVGQAARWMRL